MSVAEVHMLFDKNASDIPAMLRESAHNIETEASEGYSPTRAMIAVQVAENGKIQVYGWGRTDTADAIGVLVMGTAHLTNTQFNRQMQDE